jgi:hypothetical protein
MALALVWALVWALVLVLLFFFQNLCAHKNKQYNHPIGANGIFMQKPRPTHKQREISYLMRITPKGRAGFRTTTQQNTTTYFGDGGRSSFGGWPDPIVTGARQPYDRLQPFFDGFTFYGPLSCFRINNLRCVLCVVLCGHSIFYIGFSWQETRDTVVPSFCAYVFRCRTPSLSIAPIFYSS